MYTIIFHSISFPRLANLVWAGVESWLFLKCELITTHLIEVETARASLRRQESDLNNLSAPISSHLIHQSDCTEHVYFSVAADILNIEKKATNLQNRVKGQHFDSISLYWPFKDGSFVVEASDRGRPLKCSK